MIVMKFGGTSVGDAQRILHVSRIIKSRIKEKPVVVVSAVSGITDLLLQGGKSAREGLSKNGALEKIKEIHTSILTTLGLEDEKFQKFYDELSRIYEGIYLLKEFTPRSRDLVASFGERISARIVASCLNKEGVAARPFDAWDVGFITTSEFLEANLLPEASAKIRKFLSSCKEVPVITGFIGKDAQGHITTLGRGGSDFTASLIGSAINAKAIEIWTDVSGIMSADPRLIPNARTIPMVSFQEAAELSAFGAKVLHPKTIEPAMKKKIPVLVKNTFKPSAPGTMILPESKKGSGLKAVTVKKEITALNVYSTGMLEARGFLAKIFGILEKYGMSVDVVTTAEAHVSLTLDNTDGLESAVKELRDFAEVSVERDRAMICLVGEGLKETPGIAGRMFNILGKAGINVEMISLGASQINLTFVIRTNDSTKVVQLLHREFFE